VRVIAIDWSGAKKPGQKIWLAQANLGQIEVLAPIRSQKEAIDRVIEYGAEGPSTVIGLDFAYSFPAWFLRSHELSTVSELWRLVEQEGERWLSACDPPFWGRPGKKQPQLDRFYRRTEEKLRRVGHRPKSCFQIGGAGAVGTGSIRGMPFLAKAMRAGFAIWPFDAASTRMIVEIYPRVLTGPVSKSSANARAEYLVKNWPRIHSSMRNCAASSEDAFDAAVSALVMDSCRSEFAALQSGDEVQKLEGEVWLPLSTRNGHDGSETASNGLSI